MRKQLPIFLRGLMVLALFLTVSVSWGQITIVNYNFNSGTSYTALTSTNATNVTSSVSSSEIFTTYSGTASGDQAFVSNNTAGNALSMANSSGTNAKYFQFQLGGTALSTYSKYKIYYQAQRSNSGATTLRISYSTNGTTFTNFPTTGSSGNGSFNQILADLSTVTALDNASAVYIRIYVSGASSTGTIRVDNFQVSAQGVSNPTVSTTAITDAANISTNSATVPGGDVTASGGATVTARGIVWGIATAPTTANNVLNATEGAGTGAFTVGALTSLSSNTHYYYRAFATNSAGTSYGTEYSFYTKALTPGTPAVGTVNRTINSLSVIVDANGNNAGVTYAIRVNGTNYVQADGTVAATEVFRTAADWDTTIVTGLTANTSYSFDVRARTTAGTVTGTNALTDYSAVATESTLPATSPTLLSDTTSLDFGALCLNTTTTQSFSFTGTNISGNATLTVSAVSGYSYSLTENGTYTPTLTITDFTGAATTVWVEFDPQAVAQYDGSILVEGLESNSSAQLMVMVTGEGVNTPGSVATVSAANITQLSAVLGGITISGCSDVTAYGIEYSNASGFINGTAVAANNLTDGNFSATVSGLEPGATYYYKAFITDAAGTHYGNELSFTTSSLSAPVAEVGTTITQTSFTANWTAVEGATGYRLDVATNPAFITGGLATDLFFSEYVEGSGTNRVLEIYNGTGASVNLSNYRISLYPNGAQGANSSLNLTGTIANGATYVITSSDVFYSNANLVNTTITSFNGDDAIALIKISTGNFVDIIGQIGNDPGTQWAAAGGFSTLDKTLVRKSNVTGGVTVNPTEGFATLATEWDVYDQDTTTYLGSHTFDYANYLVEGYNNLNVNNQTSYSVTNLDPYTNYYYRVRAFSAGNTSENSNVITVLTKPAVVTWTGEPAAWVPAVALDTTMTAVIDADYRTGTNGTFISKSVVLNEGSTFTVSTGTTLTVEENIVNNAAAEDFVVENNAAVLQNTATANTTDVTVIKNSNPLYRLDYTLWSSPVSGETLGDFAPDTADGRMYEYKYGLDATTGQEVEQYFTVAPSTVFEAGKGYLIRMPNSNLAVPGYNGGEASFSFEGTFEGAPHNGEVTRTASIEGNRYTAVGNPYPSPISVLDFFNTNSGVINGTSGLYFWRKRNNAEASSYATLTLAAYTANEGDPTYVPNPAEGGDLPGQAAYYNGPESSWIISQGQGFFVQTAVNPTDAVITFNNSMRRSAPVSGEQAFFRTAASTRSRLWLNLTGTESGFSQAAIAYIDNATNGFDYGYDAAMLNDGGRVALYSLAEDSALAIQARPSFTTTDVVPMGFIATTVGQYSISIDHTDGLFAQGQDIYLKDNMLGTIVSLDNAYTFSTEAGTFNNRFEVVYTTDALGTDAPVLNADTVMVYKQGNAIHINTGNTEMTGVTVYDINGRKLYSKDTTGVNTTVDNLNAAQQVLIIEVNTVSGKVSKKIVY